MKTFRQIGNYSLVKFPNADRSNIKHEIKDKPHSKVDYSYGIDDKEYERVIDLSDDEFLIYCKNIIEKSQRIETKNYDLAQKISNELKIGICTCGNCGRVNLHDFNIEADVQCEGCGEEMDFSDCPDLFYVK